MKIHSRLLAPVFLMALLLIPAGCARGGERPETEKDFIVVGFSQVGAESDWRVANTESMRETFTEENGYELIFDNAKQKQENQILAIRTFIQQRVDYIVLAPVTENGWESVLEEARDAGIPLIIMDRQVDVADPALYTSRVGSDFRGEADLAAQWLADQLERSGRQDEEIRILHVQGTEGATAQLLRTEGLEDAVEAHANWTIAAQLQGGFTEAKAYEAAGAFFAEDRDIDVVYCENDNMAFGVMDAMDDAGIAYGKNGGVIVISFDAVRRALEACLDGRISLCVECNPLLGPKVEELIAKLEAGETPPKDSYVDETWFTRNRLTQTVIDARAY